MWPFKKNKKLNEDDWRLVKTVDTTINWADEGKEKGRKDFVYYYLYENPYGRRKMEYKHTNKHLVFPRATEYSTRNICLEIEYYLNTVYPWTKGEPTIDTPSYWDMVDAENEKCVKELYRRLLRNSRK